MKKFIINFDYNGFLFSAKVLVKRGDSMMIQTSVLNHDIAWMLNDGQLMFLQKETGFELLLFKRGRSFEKLDWKIKLEYVDKTYIVDTEVFSLS